MGWGEENRETGFSQIITAFQFPGIGFREDRPQIHVLTYWSMGGGGRPCPECGTAPKLPRARSSVHTGAWPTGAIPEHHSMVTMPGCPSLEVRPFLHCYKDTLIVCFIRYILSIIRYTCVSKEKVTFQGRRGVSYNLLKSFLDYKFHSTIKTGQNKAGAVAGTVARTHRGNMGSVWCARCLLPRGPRAPRQCPWESGRGFLSSNKTNATDTAAHCPASGFFTVIPDLNQPGLSIHRNPSFLTKPSAGCLPQRLPQHSRKVIQDKLPCSEIRALRAPVRDSGVSP